jgi:acetolactate synthase-1/3 small subunit
MSSNVTTATRAHHSNAPQGSEQTYTLIIELEDRPGAVDRVVGVLRRRRSLMQTFALSPSTQPAHVRITAQVQDAQVVIDHLVEQLRKVVDVKRVDNLNLQQTVVRELALIQVDATQSDINTLIDAVRHFGVTAVDVTPEIVTFEVTGSSEKIAQVIAALQPFGIREIARSGSVAMTRQHTRQSA